MHDWLNQFAEQRAIQLVVLSMDTAVDHDLRLFLEGRVAAAVAGSPCETFSAARHHSLGEGHYGPRPLRSTQRLWGLAGLTLRELRQLGQGSIFQLQVLWCLTQMRITGGVGVSEHPGTPQEPEKASIWRSALVTVMLKDGHFRLHQLPQFLFGAPAVKMTGFLCLRLPWFRRHLLEHQIEGIRKPDAQAIGVDCQGQFRTSALKEYPPQLCAGLAYAVVQGLTQAHRSGAPPGENLDQELSEWVDKAAEISAVIQQDSVWLPEYII